MAAGPWPSSSVTTTTAELWEGGAEVVPIEVVVARTISTVGTPTAATVTVYLPAPTRASTFVEMRFVMSLEAELSCSLEVMAVASLTVEGAFAGSLMMYSTRTFPPASCRPVPSPAARRLEGSTMMMTSTYSAGTPSSDARLSATAAMTAGSEANSVALAVPTSNSIVPLMTVVAVAGAAATLVVLAMLVAPAVVVSATIV
mmetsp:Transcript_55045/g.147384  ORF Transcript_55045/g.147384 Transcript_55045/m.147384 type:complete len:201 (+) Transcript_55045:409-1011(+)